MTEGPYLGGDFRIPPVDPKEENQDDQKVREFPSDRAVHFNDNSLVEVPEAPPLPSDYDV